MPDDQRRLYAQRLQQAVEPQRVVRCQRALLRQRRRVAVARRVPGDHARLRGQQAGARQPRGGAGADAMQQHDGRPAGSAAAVGHLRTALDSHHALRKPAAQGLQ
ncbi:hypothetical protein D3C72_1496960 [compost metagenome]